jgi:hypothetical protein
MYPASAHDKWSNGRAIPAWVKAHCCNNDEAHDLTAEKGIKPEDVKVISKDGEVKGYLIPGFNNMVIPERVYPSQDSHVWIFYYQGFDYDSEHSSWSAKKDISNASIWCAFMPCITREDMPNELKGECS